MDNMIEALLNNFIDCSNIQSDSLKFKKKTSNQEKKEAERPIESGKIKRLRSKNREN